MYYKPIFQLAITIALLFNPRLVLAVHSQERIDTIVQSWKTPAPYMAKYTNRWVSILEGESFGQSYGFRLYSGTEFSLIPITQLIAWGEESALSEYLSSILPGDQESPDDDPDKLIPNLTIPDPEPSQFDALPEDLRLLKQELMPYILAAEPSTAENSSKYTFERLGAFPEAMQSANGMTVSNNKESSEDDDSSTNDSASEDDDDSESEDDDDSESEDNDSSANENASEDDDSSQLSPPETSQTHLDSMIPLLQQAVDAVLSGESSLRNKEDVVNLKESLHGIYPAKLSEALKKANISEERYIQWQRESEQVKAKLIPDPLIVKLEQDELSEYLLELQARFRVEGIHGFTCPDEFTVILENMVILLKTEKNKLAENSYVRERLGLLEQEMIAAKGSVISLTYINLMTLVVKFIGIYNALGMYEFATEYSGFESGEMTESDLNYLIDQYFAMTTEKLLQKDFVLSSISADLLGSITSKSFHYFDKNITDYLRSEPDYLVWPTVSDFSASFFPKAGRYPMFVAGIQTAVLSFHDDRLMSRASLFFHDFSHANHMRNAITEYLKIGKGQIDKSFSENAKKILDTVNYVLHRLTLSRHVDFAVWISIFKINHDIARPLQTLTSQGVSIRYCTLQAFEESGIDVEEGFTFLHLRAADKILMTLFPKKNP